MQITDVRVRKVAKEGKLKAVVSITMDEEFVVHDIKVIEGEKGLFIAMPSKKALDGEYRDIAHPINSEKYLFPLKGCIFGLQEEEFPHVKAVHGSGDDVRCLDGSQVRSRDIPDFAKTERHQQRKSCRKQLKTTGHGQEPYHNAAVQFLIRFPSQNRYGKCLFWHL